ncbi:MAG: DUF4286 family protein [Dehalococcoidia bacterium]
MPGSILLVYSNCPEGQEDEFNRWYDTVHVPDLLALDGVVAARRFALSGPGIPMTARDGSATVARFLAMYELDSDDTRTMMRRINQAHNELVQQGRVVAYLQVVGAATYLPLGERRTAAGNDGTDR